MASIDEIIFSEMGGSVFGHNASYMLYDQLGTKPKSSYTESQNKAIALVSLNENNVIPFGSFTYRAQQYPGDIDVMEQVPVCCSKEEAIKVMEKGLKDLVKKIDKLRGYYLGDVKVGLDLIYNIDIGQWQNGVLYNYDYESIVNQINYLHDNGYFNDIDYNQLINTIKIHPTHDEHDEFYEELRKHFVLRWSDKELLQGYKIVLPNRKITLKQALEHKTMVKIDIWAPVNGKYLEVSNFYILIELTNDGKHVLVNLPQDYLDTFEQSIKKEVEKLFYSKVYYKPFKLVKRLWSLARINKDLKMIYYLTPLISSEASLLSQVNSEIDTLILMLENLVSLPIKTMINQIDLFRSKFSTLIEIDYKEEQNIDHIISNIVENYENMSRNELINDLKFIKKYNTQLINDFTISYLKAYKVVPIPRNFLPEKLKY
jgi:hypothetical protein